jgi:hypothetical protein
MTNYVQKQMSYFFSSSEALGAKKYNNGSRFTISMQNLTNIPKTAIDCTLEISSANIWHVSPNIDDVNWKNDKVYLIYNPNAVIIDDGLGDPNDFLITITLPKGLYGLSNINDTISELIQTVVLPNSERLSATSIILTGDSPTQKVKVQFESSFLRLVTESSLEYPNNIASTLGFTTGEDIGPSTFEGQRFTADSIASLNKINRYLIHSDLIRSGLTLNGKRLSIMTEVQINVQPSKLITFRPGIPYKLDGSHLTNGVHDLLTFWITNEKNEYVDMSEDWSFSLQISYLIDPAQSMMGIRLPVVSSQS